MTRQIIWIGLIITVLALAGCDAKDGVAAPSVVLPTDSALDLYSANEGVHPCIDVLDNPDNPYANASLNQENVWDLHDAIPSPKADFYLWSTMLAIIPTGEYQFYAARALHELYTVGGSENAKNQAKKAYRAVLDHFFDSVTWWNAWWIDEDTYYAVTLRNMVGANLYDPTEENLLPLYDDPAEALADLSEWGYVYDQESGTLVRYQ